MGSSLNFEALGVPTEEAELASGAFMSRGGRVIRHATLAGDRERVWGV